MLAFASAVLQRLDGVVLDRARMELAATVGLEHFTALLGEQLLTTREQLRDADPEFAALWLWHAVEEIEHKAVAFDVFKTIGGTYTERIVAFVIATIAIYLKLLHNAAQMLHRDGELFDPEAWLELVYGAVVEPGMFRKAVPGYFAYLRPDFHPWDQDDRPLIELFRREYETTLAPFLEARTRRPPRRKREGGEAA